MRAALIAFVLALVLGACAQKHELQPKPVRGLKLKAVGSLAVEPAASAPQVAPK